MSTTIWVAATPVRATVESPLPRALGQDVPPHALLSPPPPPPVPDPPPFNVAAVQESRSLAGRLGDLLTQLNSSLRSIETAPPVPEPVATPTEPPPSPKRRGKWGGKVRLWAV